MTTEAKMPVTIGKWKLKPSRSIWMSPGDRPMWRNQFPRLSHGQTKATNKQTTPTATSALRMGTKLVNGS